MSRIIAGAWRGRPLATPKGDRTRPTSDRVREAVFAALAVWAGNGGDLDAALADLTFLDLFAGSGGMGLEAASRGARATLVEKDRDTARVITGNVRTLGAGCDVVAESAESFCRRSPARPYDVVWLDPPYAYPADELDSLLELLVEHRVVAPDGLIVAERATRSDVPAPPAGFVLDQTRRYGETTVFFMGEAE